jgi:hypothetical protein
MWNSWFCGTRNSLSKRPGWKIWPLMWYIQHRCNLLLAFNRKGIDWKQRIGRNQANQWYLQYQKTFSLVWKSIEKSSWFIVENAYPKPYVSYFCWRGSAAWLFQWWDSVNCFNRGTYIKKNVQGSKNLTFWKR